MSVRRETVAGFGGAPLAVHRLGAGRPVLLLHGLFSDANTNWIKFGHAQKLADAGFEAIMPDLRAHGDSARPHDAAAYPRDVLVRDVFAVEPFVGGLSITVFSLFMALARLFMDTVVDRYSPRVVAGALLAIAAVGLIIVGVAPHPYVALFGFLLMGLGCSSVYPLAVSAAAQRTDRPASVNVASLGQMTFVVFFLGPPLLGFVAESFGIRTSYFVVVPLVIAALLVIRALSPRPTPVLSEPEPLTPNG